MKVWAEYAGIARRIGIEMPGSNRHVEDLADGIKRAFDRGHARAGEIPGGGFGPARNVGSDVSFEA